MPLRLTLSQRTVEELSAEKRSYVYDSQVPHLAVCVHPTGRKIWYRCGWVHGRSLRIKIGEWPALSVKDARRECLKLDSKIADGFDPNAGTIQRLRPQSTFGEMFAYYLESHAKPHKDTWQRDERRFQTHLKPWRHRKLRDISKGDVRALHVRLRASIGHYGANHVLELIRMVFAVAMRDEVWHGTNPATGIKRFSTRSRERFLSPEELERWFAAVEQLQRATTRDYLLTLLFTGARRGNVAAMRWEQLDLANGTWTIPGASSKNREPMTIVLPSVVVELLANRKLSSHSDWVFPGGGKTGHIVEPKAAWKQVCERAGLQDVRIHDLRRTLGSWQAAAGSSLHIIGKSLGHKSTSATQIYARLQLDPVRASVETAVQAMLHSAKPPADAEKRDG